MLTRATAQSHARRHVNRILVLCSSINDVTAWPFWKFLQMKRLKSVTDMAFLAFSSHGGSFEAGIQGEKYTLKNYARVRGYRRELLEEFVHRWHDPGRSYFVYGGHGMGDYLELEQDKTVLQAHELARMLGTRRFEAMVFDACFMANLDCVYHLRHNTRYIGACEGYMWEPDTELDLHVLNAHNASVMSRGRDARAVLHSIQRDYCARCPRGDFAILDTRHVAALHAYVHAHVMPRVYDRATLYSTAQQQQLRMLAAQQLQRVHARYGNRLAGVDGASTLSVQDIALTRSSSSSNKNNSSSSSNLALVEAPATTTTAAAMTSNSTSGSSNNSSSHYDLQRGSGDGKCRRRDTDTQGHMDNTPSGAGVDTTAMAARVLCDTETLPSLALLSPQLPARLTRRQRVEQAIQFEHALYPSEVRDKHLVDLRSYLVDMAIEEAQDANTASSSLLSSSPGGDVCTATSTASSSSGSSSGGRANTAAAAMTATPPQRVVRNASRALCVEQHGTLPPVQHIPCSPPLAIDDVHKHDTQPRSNNSSDSDSLHTKQAAASPTTMSTMSSSSPFAASSAHTGLALFDKVVVRHCTSRTPELYAARLGGLSLTVHEYSALSRPLCVTPPSSSSCLLSSSSAATTTAPQEQQPQQQPQQQRYTLARRALARKVRLFLRHGRLDEVHMRATSQPPPSPSSSSAAATAHVHTRDPVARAATGADNVANTTATSHLARIATKLHTATASLTSAQRRRRTKANCDTSAATAAATTSTDTVTRVATAARNDSTRKRNSNSSSSNDHDGHGSGGGAPCIVTRL